MRQNATEEESKRRHELLRPKRASNVTRYMMILVRYRKRATDGEKITNMKVHPDKSHVISVECHTKMRDLRIELSPVPIVAPRFKFSGPRRLHCVVYHLTGRTVANGNGGREGRRQMPKTCKAASRYRVIIGRFWLRRAALEIIQLKDR